VPTSTFSEIGFIESVLKPPGIGRNTISDNHTNNQTDFSFPIEKLGIE
jgi:hypothetical protein